MFLRTTLISFTLCSTTVFAATQIETEVNGHVQKVLIANQQARMEGDKSAQYMLINIEKQTMYAVDDTAKRIVVIDMQHPVTPTTPPLPPNVPAAPEIKAELVNVGEGEKIAGYTTVRYQMKANGSICSDNYFSSEVTKIADVKIFSDLMYESTQLRKKNMTHPMMFANICMQAQMQLESQFKEKGTLLKAVDVKTNKVMQQVLAVKTNVNAPAEVFTLPKEYEQVSEVDMMQRIQSELMKKFEEARLKGTLPTQMNPAGTAEGKFTAPPVPMPTTPAQTPAPSPAPVTGNSPQYRPLDK